MPDIKIAIWCAAAAGLLSFIAALIGPVGFAAVLLRSLGGGIGFGLLSYGLLMVLHRFVPEIFDQTGGPAAEDEEIEVEQGSEARPGAKLDIVVDNDEPDFSQTAAYDGGQGEGESEDDTFIEEVAEEDSHGEDASGSEGAVSAAGASTEKEPSITEEFQELSDVDTLPDLDNFSDAFEGVAASQDEGGGYSSSTGGSMGSRDESVDILGEEHDPATIAKAVRTIIGKDQEG